MCIRLKLCRQIVSLIEGDRVGDGRSILERLVHQSRVVGWKSYGYTRRQPSVDSGFVAG